MIRKALCLLLLAILLFSVTLITGCIPPFFEGDIDPVGCFGDSVYYTTFTVDAGSEDGYIESEVKARALIDYTDGDEDNIAMLSYRSFGFVTATEDGNLTGLAFIIQAEDDCNINLAVSYGENIIASERLGLQAGVTYTVYFLELDVKLRQGVWLSVSVTNPIELGSVKFRTDSYIFLGQEV